MVDWEKIVAPDFWKAFRVPAFAFAFAVLALLLLTRNVNEVLEWVYIRQVANYAIGASIIAYGHFLFHATWIKRKKDVDLPFWIQALAIVIHIAWFGWFLVQATK